MDFKVAGTSEGVTALQMDIKITGITEEIMRVALFQAKEGRMHILGKMAEALEKARPGLGEHAPRIEQIKVPTDKIREIIGTGGKVIREIVEFSAFVNFFGARDGLVHVSELAPQRVQKVGDVVSEGQMVKVKFLGMDNRGKIRLSMKVVDQATGEDLSKKQEETAAPADAE
jgi:polyribonucleotide nucleotidyltransferase